MSTTHSIGAVSEFPATHADLLDAPFGTLATIDPDGRPQLTEVWFLHEDGKLELWLNGEKIGEYTNQGLLLGPEFSQPR